MTAPKLVALLRKVASVQASLGRLLAKDAAFAADEDQRQYLHRIAGVQRGLARDIAAATRALTAPKRRKRAA